MRGIRPSSTTTLTAVSSSPARSIRPAGAPFSQTVPTSASGAIVRKRESRVATRSRATTGRRTAAASPPPGPRAPGPPAAAVRDQHDVGREHVEQHLNVAGPQRRQETVDDPLLLG